MNWHRLVGLFALAIAVGDCAGADAPPKAAHIGFLRAEAPDALFTPFRDGMRDLGYIEGRNLVIEQRWANGKYADLPRLAQELVNLKVEVIFASCTPCVEAARSATRSIPIVTVSGDPVEMALVESLSRPGGNVTGLTLMLGELSTKRLELLKETAPGVSRVAVLWSGENPIWSGIISRMKRSGPALGMQVEAVKILGPDQVEAALATLVTRRGYALYVFEDPMLRGKSAQIVAFAAKHRIPAIYGGADFVRNGGLISYGPSFDDLFRRAAGYVAQILAGANPATLPMEQPTKYQLAVNLRTAKTLGMRIPESVLVRADEVIQ